MHQTTSIAVVFALLLAALLSAACSDSGADRPVAAAVHVGTATCARCHPRQTSAWTGSQHDLAMQEPTAQTVLGDFDDVTFTHYGTTTTFSRDGGTFMVHTAGPTGALQDYPVKYVFGVTPLQQYLIELPRGHLQALGVCWDSRPADQGGQHWFHLYPNESIPHDDELHWTGRNQNWNYMCASCHSTDLRKNYDLATDSYATTWSELDVACEACHGAGSRHLAWAEAGEAGDDSGLLAPLNSRAVWYREAGARTATRRPAVATHTEVETCAPCHARRSVLDENVVPGRPFLDTHRPALLEEGLYYADGQILDEVYVYGSFVQSKMYHAGVTCSDCHDPHSLALRAPGNALCTRCHNPGFFDTATHHFHESNSDGAQCVACHMPAKTYMVVDPRRDHSIRIPRPDLSMSLGTPNACTGCHDDQTAAWASAAIVAHRPDYTPPPHWAEALYAGRRGDATAPAALAAVAVNPGYPAIARASAYALLARYPGRNAVDALRPALRAADPLVRLGALEAIEGLPAQARLSLVAPFLLDPIRTVRSEAARLLNAVPRGELPAELRDAFDAALRELVAFQNTNADQPWAHINLGLLSFERREFGNAETEYRQALRLDPRSLRASVNLADLYREVGRELEAEQALRRGLEFHPDSAEMHHALGLALVRRKQIEDAVRHLEHAARLRPANPRFGYVYAVALHSLRNTAGALQVLAEVHQRHPTDRDVLSALMSYCRDGGDTNAALGWAEKLLALAPEDRAVAEVVQQLRATIGR